MQKNRSLKGKGMVRKERGGGTAFYQREKKDCPIWREGRAAKSPKRVFDKKKEKEKTPMIAAEKKEKKEAITSASDWEDGGTLALSKRKKKGEPVFSTIKRKGEKKTCHRICSSTGGVGEIM